MAPDNELLRCYAEARSEEAFAELVRRHVNLAYSTALRQLNGDSHQAQDATQSVFTDMARKASALSRRTSLTSWIYTSAHFAARDIVRRESRRRKREETFMGQPIHDPAPDTDWDTLRPILDDVMHQLKEADREAILLRYFENWPLAEVGAKLGLTENTARMRVERALEKLRGILARRGIATTSSLLAVIAANAINAAPAEVAASLVANSAATAAATGGTSTILKIMTATKLKFALGALAVVSATSLLILQHQAQTKLRLENQSLRNEMQQLRSDYESASNQLVAAGQRKPPIERAGDLARLRAEVDRLRRRTNELAHLPNATPTVGASADSPDNVSPAEQEQRASIAKMHDAKLLVLGEIIFAQQNQGQVATNFDQINSYLTNAPEPLTGTNLFELVYHGSLNDLTNPASALLMRESQPWQTLGGKWARSYAFADGHSEVHVQPSDNFDDFEQQHLAAAP